MRLSRQVYVATLSPLLIIFLAFTSIQAADEEPDEYEIQARVARISLISGAVVLKREGTTDWEQAQLNLALVEGDVLRTEPDARLEIQIDARNFLRIGASSVVRLVTLRDEGIALSLVEGTLSVRLGKFDREREYFEIDAPKTTLAAEKNGLYRIDVSDEARVRLTVSDGGRARIYSETSGFALRDGRAAELITEGPNAGDWELMVAAVPDALDAWVGERDRFLAQRAPYNPQYFDSYLWGAEELYSYGNWLYANDYGWIWQPHTSVISSYDNWSPYRYGHWNWCPPYGWTWVGYEPWGWAPYHYGRWVYYNNYWAWSPRSHHFRHRSWWRPALVAFVSLNFSFGDQICWYPLSYHQRDPYSRRYRNTDRFTPLRRQELADLRRVNPAYLRAVTAVPAREFGGGRARLQPATENVARRVITAEPLRGSLPVRLPAASGASAVEGPGRIDTGRAAPARFLVPARATGAAPRTPGAPLDDHLRRTRILNGRELRIPSPVESGSQAESGATGAVARPRRPMSSSERQGEPARGAQDVTRPENRNNQPGRINEPAAAPQRATPIERAPATSDAQSSRPERRESPKRVERPDEPQANPQPAERKYEPPTQRSQPPPRYEPPARSSPPPSRSEAPARTEAPRRSESPPSSSPPARSSPQPRSEPQQKSETARPAPRETARPARGKNDP